MTGRFWNISGGLGILEYGWNTAGIRLEYNLERHRTGPHRGGVGKADGAHREIFQPAFPGESGSISARAIYPKSYNLSKYIKFSPSYCLSL